ncbi:hypothetical protein [Arthrobacter sp. UNC362MFTsu5.1]|uniref:hypothetical protein n=1 Tax=Arthrobacter sp. UNC362MFTsu5.1 TaxID=1449044 RepID=UPI0004897F82|nr:hypothetical protein [Arthrobacter sp. UNC362MFTsu5.1]
MATGGQFCWPPAGIFVAAYGQFFMAANNRTSRPARPFSKTKDFKNSLNRESRGRSLIEVA